MGCDIHLFVETQDPDGAWSKLGDVFPNPHYNPQRYEQTLAEAVERDPDLDRDGFRRFWGETYYLKEKTDQPYDGRSYMLFSLLADVRNGISAWSPDAPSGHVVVPISQPRGWPLDASFPVECGCDESGNCGHPWGGDHSHTWLGLREVVQADYDQSVVIAGVVESSVWDRTLRTGDTPENWSGGIGGGRIRVVSMDYYAAHIRELRREYPVSEEAGARGAVFGRSNLWVTASWRQPLRGLVADWLDLLAGIAEGYDWDRTRLVFGFDS